MLQNNFNYFLLTHDGSCFSLLCADKRRGNWIWVYEILVFLKKHYTLHTSMAMLTRCFLTCYVLICRHDGCVVTVSCSNFTVVTTTLSARY